MVPQQQSLLASSGTAAASGTAEREASSPGWACCCCACSALVSVSVVWPQLIARDLTQPCTAQPKHTQQLRGCSLETEGISWLSLVRLITVSLKAEDKG